MMRKKARSLTAKDLGLVDGVRLSDTFANTRKHFKIVEDHVIGYAVYGDGRLSMWGLAPIYRATIHDRSRAGHEAISTSYEVGQVMNPRQPYIGDPLDCLAMAAATACRGLEVAAQSQVAKGRKKK